MSSTSASVRPGWPWYGFWVALAAGVIVPTVPVFAGYLPDPIVAAAGLLLITSGLLIVTTRYQQPYLTVSAATAALPALLLLGISLYPPLVVLLAFPTTWLSAVWTGPPQGPGIDLVGIVAPPNRYPIDVVIGFKPAIALLMLAVASAVATHAVHRRRTSALEGLAFGGPAAVLMAMAAFGLPWPAVAFTVLVTGLALTVAAGLTELGPWRRTVVGTQGIVYVVSGLLGTLATRWSTVLALVLIVAGAALVGALGKAHSRVPGWLFAVLVAAVAATVGGLAVGRAPREAAFGVLGAAVLALVVGAAIRNRRRRESSAIEATAHITVLAALALTAGWVHPAQLVCAIWGSAVLARAWWPGVSRSDQRFLACYAGVWFVLAAWLLLAEHGVRVTEVYTLPMAGLAALAGWACLRRWRRVRLTRAMLPAALLMVIPTAIEALDVDGPGDLVRWLVLAAVAATVVGLGLMRRRRELAPPQ
jgi:hypothetical protein